MSPALAQAAHVTSDNQNGYVHYQNLPGSNSATQRTRKLHVLIEADREPSEGLQRIENTLREMEKAYRTLILRSTDSSLRPYYRSQS
jgi:hypothetical protein